MCHCSAISYVYRQASTSCFFFFNDTATTEIYTLSLHDALPISYYRAEHIPAEYDWHRPHNLSLLAMCYQLLGQMKAAEQLVTRSEEHTSELQSQSNLVCRLLLEKKKRTCRRLPRCILSLDCTNS